MTKMDYEQRIREAKLTAEAKVKSAHKEYEVAMSDIRRRRHECNIESNYIATLRQKYINEAREEYADLRAEIERVWQEQREAEHKAGRLVYNDFLDALSIIYRFLKQEDNDGIMLPWGVDMVAEVRFKKQEGGEL